MDYVNVLTAIASIIVISISASYAISAIIRYSKKTGISDYVIGFLVLSIGTSLPELSTAIVGSMSNQGSLILGNIIGANIIDMTLILGIIALIGKKIALKGKILDKTILTVFILVLIPLGLGMDGKLSSFDGLILLGAYIFYAARLIKKEESLGYVKKQVPFREIARDMFIFLGSMIALLLSARWLLISSLHMSLQSNIPPFFIGLVFIAIGTTVPELTVGIKSMLKKHSDIGFGDLIGAVVTNSTFVLAVAAIIRPIVFDSKTFIPAAFFMVTCVLIGILYLNKKEITWREGIALILLYLTFIVSQVIFRLLH